MCHQASSLGLRVLQRGIAAMQLAESLIKEAVNSMGQDVIGALSDATSPCAKPIILRAGFLTFGDG